MKCEKCGSGNPTTEHSVQNGTKTELKQLCKGCAPAGVPKIKPATDPGAVKKFMEGGPVAVLAQTPEAADANLAGPDIKKFEAVTPEPIEVPTTPVAETLSPQPPDAPVPGEPVAIGVASIDFKIEGYVKDIKALHEALGKKEREVAQLRQIITAKAGAKAALEDLRK